tara:strand:- start:11909 stop:12142 length:234 start_codon:yes stop_codon:yes gene_type:complete
MLSKYDYIKLFRGEKANDKTRMVFLKHWCKQEGKNFYDLKLILNFTNYGFDNMTYYFDNKYKVSILVDQNGVKLKVI